MGLELLFQGSNIERLLNGLWVTAEIRLFLSSSPVF